MTMTPILQLGKGGLTPQNTAAVEEALGGQGTDQDQRPAELHGRPKRNGTGSF